MDVASLERQTGWHVHGLAETSSTNDVAAHLVRGGAPARTVVLADRQSAGRGRQARRFASPVGGLYASLLVAARPEDLPARVVAWIAVAAAEAIEAVTGCRAQIKWPNDLWLEGRKVGGILLEMSDPRRPVVAGIGLNVRAVPTDLPEEVRERLTALDVVAGRAIDSRAVLVHLLQAVDAWQTRLVGAAADLERAWRERLALVGEQVGCTFAGRALEGVLEDVSLSHGLLLRDGVSGPVWRPAEHVQDLRAVGRTIS